jgi:nitrate/nitrite transporter NarK
LFSWSPSFFWIVTSRVVVGFGDALIWLNIVTVLARWFSYGVFGRVLGITAMAGNVGALVATVPLAVWIDAVGWRIPFVVMGSILISLAGVSGVIFNRLTPAHPDWKAQSANVPWRDVLGSGRRIVMVSLAHFGLMGPFLGFVSLLAVPYLRQNYHFSEVAAGTFLGFGLLGSLVGGPVAGILADRFRVARPYQVIAAVNLTGWATIVVWPSHLPLVVLGLVFSVLGMANGASVLTFAAVRERYPSHAVGLASGVANTAGFLSAVLVPVLMGLALSSHHASQIELAVVLPFALIGLMATLAMSYRHKKSQKQE